MTEGNWKCSNCGYTLQAKTPPDECPSCHHKCDFVNITCYTPDCEGSETDPRFGKPGTAMDHNKHNPE